MRLIFGILVIGASLFCSGNVSAQVAQPPAVGRSIGSLFAMCVPVNEPFATSAQRYSVYRQPGANTLHLIEPTRFSLYQAEAEFNRADLSVSARYNVSGLATSPVITLTISLDHRQAIREGNQTFATATRTAGNESVALKCLITSANN